MEQGNDLELHHSSSIILSKFGFGQNEKLENKITDQVEKLMTSLTNTNGKAFDPAHRLTKIVLNVTSSIVFGKIFQTKDPGYHKFFQVVENRVHTATNSFEIDHFPILRFFPKYKDTMKIIQEDHQTVQDFLREQISRRKLYGERGESLVNFFMEERAIKNDSDLDNPVYCQLTYALRDLFLAGTETTASTLLWMLALLANDPKVQRTIQQEIDANVPYFRLPAYVDKNKLPFAEATILEVMRLKTAAPLALPHSTKRNITVAGYDIPADSTVCVNCCI